MQRPLPQSSLQLVGAVCLLSLGSAQEGMTYRDVALLIEGQLQAVGTFFHSISNPVAVSCPLNYSDAGCFSRLRIKAER